MPHFTHFRYRHDFKPRILTNAVLNAGKFFQHFVFIVQLTNFKVFLRYCPVQANIGLCTLIYILLAVVINEACSNTKLSNKLRPKVFFSSFL